MAFRKGLKQTWVDKEFSRKIKLDSAELDMPVTKFTKALCGTNLKEIVQKEIKRKNEYIPKQKKFTW